MKHCIFFILFMWVAVSTHATECTQIKGLVHRSNPNLKFYLTPEHYLYSQVQNLDETRGERCFATESEAKEARFLKLPNTKQQVTPIASSTSPKPAQTDHETNTKTQSESRPNVLELVPFDPTPAEKDLVTSAQKGYTDAVELLLAQGTNEDAVHFGMTPLIAASMGGHIDVVKLLLNDGANPNIKGMGGFTALMFAVTEGNGDIVKLLLAHDADPNVKEDTEGLTALILAIIRGHVEIVKLLLQHGADVNAKTNDGTTVLQTAEKAGHPETIRLLKEAGAK